MLVKEYVQDVETFGIDETQGFTIKASAKAFKILIGNLYSDPITAIIRELSCNAYDAHVAAGKSNVPFKVKLPNQLDPSFSVQDFGIGLCHKDVMNLYTTFFDSTKTDSNEFIGALGLGSKTPFAYVGSFTVISVFDGQKRSYTAYMNEKGSPVISMLGEEATTESPGLTVQFAVQSKDHRSFIQKAKEIFHWFNVKPTVVGVPDFKHSEIKPVVEGDNWSIVSSHGYGNNSAIFAVMGNIAYPLNGTNLNDSFKKISGLLYNANYSHMHISVPIGKLDIAASREDLHYDEETINNLNNILDKIYVDLSKRIQEKLDNIKTKWELMDILSTNSRYGKTKPDHTSSDENLFSQLLYSIINDKNYNSDFTWRKTNEFLSKDFAVMRFENPNDFPMENMIYFHNTGYSTPQSRKVVFEDKWYDSLGDVPGWARSTWLKISPMLDYIGNDTARNWSRNAEDYKKYFTLTYQRAGFIVIDDTNKGHLVAKTVKHHCITNSIKLSSVVVVRNKEGKNAVQVIKNFFEVPDDHILKVSDMVKPPVDKRAKPKQVLVFEGMNRLLSGNQHRTKSLDDIKPTRNSWSEVSEEDVPESGVYVELYNNLIANNKQTDDALVTEFINNTKILVSIDDKTKIYGIRSNHIANINKKKWVPLSVYTKKKVTQYFKKGEKQALRIVFEKLFKKQDLSAIYGVMHNLSLRYGLDAITDLVPEWSDINEYITNVSEPMGFRSKENLIKIAAYAEKNDIDILKLMNNNICKDLEANINKIFTKYKLLGAIDYYKIDDVHDDLINYIRNVNS